MNWDSLFETINKKIKKAEERRDYYWDNRDTIQFWNHSYNDSIGYLGAMYEMKELLRKRRSREAPKGKLVTVKRIIRIGE